MLFTQKMSQIGLVVPAQYGFQVAVLLNKERIFHQIDNSNLYTDTGPGSPEDWRKRAASYANLENRLLSNMKLLGIQPGDQPGNNLAALERMYAVQPETDRLEREVLELSDSLTEVQDELNLCQGYIQQLEAIVDVALELPVCPNSRFLFCLFGFVPTTNIERLRASLARIDCLLLPLQQGQPTTFVMLAGSRKDQSVLERAARSAYLNPLSLPEGMLGTPAVWLNRLKRRMQKLQEEIRNQTQLRETYCDQIRSLYWRVHTSRLLATTLSRFGKLHYTYVIQGWLPYQQLSEFEKKLKGISEDILIEVQVAARGGMGQGVPVALNHRGIFHAFESLVMNYNRPHYNEIDPTILLTITFPILFGFMFGDVGHGLVLVLIGILLASQRIGVLKRFAELGQIIIVCGMASVLFGGLFGSVFGLDDLFAAFWIRPMENILHILIVTVAGGVILLSLAYLLSLYNLAISRRRGAFFFSPQGLAGLMLYWSLIGLAVDLFNPGILPIPNSILTGVGIASAVAVMFSEALTHLVEGRRPLIKGGVATYIVQAFFELFETVIGYISNSLSYVRVGAFAVAHAGLSAVVFILAEMVGSSQHPGYWVVVILGTLFIIGFEGLIVTIQTLRLEYYEFFSKFFRGGGIPYQPLEIK